MVAKLLLFIFTCCCHCGEQTQLSIWEIGPVVDDDVYDYPRLDILDNSF